MRMVLRKLMWRLAPERRELEIREELEFHLAEEKETLQEGGASADEAERRARLDLGNVTLVEQDVRAAWGWPTVAQVLRDGRYALRALSRAPSFTATCTLMLALGIGVNASVFSLISANVFRPLPFANPGELVVLQQHFTDSGEGRRAARWSYPEFKAARAALTTVAHLSAYYVEDVNVAVAPGDPVRVSAEIVSDAYFDALRVTVAHGREFLAGEDDRPGGHPVAVLSDELWSRAFGRDVRTIGSRVLVNGVPLTVVGVAPAGFRGLTDRAELWFPHAMAPTISYPEHLTTSQHFLSVFGRLKPGVSLRAATSEVAAVGAAAAASARGPADDGRVWGAEALALETARRDPTTVRAYVVLAGAALVVLLIAIVNLSGLLLARGIARQSETAVRTALGASRGRLLLSGAVEGGVLGLLGGVAGVLLAAWLLPLVVQSLPERIGAAVPGMANLATFAEPTVDWRVTLFGAVMAVVAGIVPACFSVVRSTTTALNAPLKANARGTSLELGSIRRPTLLSLSTMVQIACAVILLVGGGLLAMEFQRLRTLDLGFNPHGVLTFRISPPLRDYAGAAAPALLERILGHIQQVPGVTSASVGLCTPLQSCSSTYVHRHGVPMELEPPLVGRHYVAPEHFETLGIRLLRGRPLSPEDRAGRPQVAVINKTAAERLWPTEDPIGKQVWFTSGGPFASREHLTTIVGIVDDVHYGSPGDPMRPDFYTSYLQFTWPYTTVMVRTEQDPMTIVPSLRSAIVRVDPNLPIYDVEAMVDRAADVLKAQRFATFALLAFAGIGLVLASVGLYGTLAYGVVQRRREIGIRLALGASRASVLRYIMAQGLTLAAAGSLAGAGGSVVLARALPALMTTTPTFDARALFGVMVFLMLVASMACYIPARAATKVNPSEVMVS